jgi:hypothetical protein
LARIPKPGKVADLRHDRHGIDQRHARMAWIAVATEAIDQVGMSSMICCVNRATRCSAVMTASI